MSIKEKLFQYIKSLIAKYGTAFPSIRTLAKVASCSERYVIDMIKQLVEEGRIRKETRYTEVDGQVRQLSNGYEIIEEPPAEKKSVHPIKAFKKSLTSSFKQNEDEYIIAPPYPPFENEIREQKIPPTLRAAILDHLRAEKDDIWNYSREAINRTLRKAIPRLMNGFIYNPPRWIITALRSEQIRLEVFSANNVGY